MSFQPPPSSSPPPPPRAPTAVTGLGDDLLREIFLRLPDLPSLVRAAFACCAFRRAVRSSRAFRRSFRALHAPPVLALFLDPNFEVAPVFPCSWRRSDPDLVAADFFDIWLSRHGDAHATGWEIQPQNHSADGYFILDKVRAGTKRRAAYNPLTQALDLYLYQPGVDIELQFYTLSSEDGQGPSRVVCVRGHSPCGERVALFSSDTMEWKFFPNNTLPLRESGYMTSRVMRGLIWWQNWLHDQIVVLDTSTFQFSLMDVPAPLMTESDVLTYKLGETNDEKLCIVDIKDKTLVSFLLTARDDDSVVERWMLYKEFPLDPIVKNVTGCPIMEEDGCEVSVQLVAVIAGFVYLSIFYCKGAQCSDLYLSLCLETSEMRELFKDTYRYNEQVHPYVMPWPPSLLQSKEESETEFPGDSDADDVPVGAEKASSVLVAALQSLSQTLMGGGGSNIEMLAELDSLLDSNKAVVELDAFLCPNEDGEGSLMSKIASFDAQLVTARDRILRISA